MRPLMVLMPSCFTLLTNSFMSELPKSGSMVPLHTMLPCNVAVLSTTSPVAESEVVKM